MGLEYPRQLLQALHFYQDGLAFCFMAAGCNVPTKLWSETCRLQPKLYCCAKFSFSGKEIKTKGDDVKSVAIIFLLTVNDTWYPSEYPGKTCLHTVKTPPIEPDIPWNESVSIAVGECDHGPLTYTISKQLDGMHMYDQLKMSST